MAATTRADWLPIYQMIGARIRDERRKQHLTQDELASRVGLKRTSITNVERGRQKILVHTLVDIANSLGTSPARFLSAFDPKAPLMLPDDLSTAVRNWIVHSVSGSARNHDK
jgi:transcriptional regulator with XRE-family HTH domain